MAEYPNVPAYQYDLALVHHELYQCMKAADKAAKARQHHREAVDVWARLAAEYPDMANYQRHLGLSAMTLGRSLAASGQSAEARRQYDKAMAAFSRGIELEAHSSAAWVGRGMAYAQRGDWDKASGDFLKAGELEPGEAVYSYWHALARLGTGDVTGYRSACAAMLGRFGKTEEAGTAEGAAWTCLLAPDAVADLARPVKLAEKAVASDPGADRYLNTLGAILYRAGRFAEAIRRLNEVTAAWDKAGKMPTRYSPAYTCFFLAMAHHRLGHSEEARQWLGKAVKQADEELQAEADVLWNRRLTLTLLRREAEALLAAAPTAAPGETKKAIPGGDPKP